jgi:aspartate carbamoyltransferase catalytic subunit
MPHLKGLLDLKDTKKEKILNLFQLAKSLKNEKSYAQQGRGTAILLFLEPSTRTRVSFEVASHREGFQTVVIQGKAATSLEKEETLEDTFLNLGAMDPMVLIVRAGDDYDISEISSSFQIPVINAGWGVKGHPSQALLDIFTLSEKWDSVAGKKLLILGDILHSRVAQSHFELARILGYEVRVFAPAAFLPKDPSIKNFKSLPEGLEWCDAVMALRTQKERHGTNFSTENFNTEWGLNSSNVKALKKDAFVLHPGPVNWGIELSKEIKTHPRSLILQQVASGVFVRQAVLRMCREGTW